MLTPHWPLRAQPLSPPTSGGGAGPDLTGCARSSLLDRSWSPSQDTGYLANRRGCSPALALDPPALQTPPRRGPRTPGLRRTQPGFSKSCRGSFRSPRPSPKSGQADGASEDSLHLDIQKLREKRDMLDEEISQLISEGYSVGELEDHISQLHTYNDIKDVGQMLLGKLAVIRGVTTRELYPEFGLDMSD
ncbi:PREDICTED: DNA repair protein SWI5 homolog [Ceratotherium simum simum]|uniref:DNA repair protein SWI5 homolog n=1 Tax=Ceratotherium simum simum TaxID=73337 RepID=A0ABM1CD13_CERSS|nr:PREDICTED: DNA repair protein SWI5 homolog [Ceratotherium simum simum]